MPPILVAEPRTRELEAAHAYKGPPRVPSQKHSTFNGALSCAAASGLAGPQPRLQLPRNSGGKARGLGAALGFGRWEALLIQGSGEPGLKDVADDFEIVSAGFLGWGQEFENVVCFERSGGLQP